MTLIFRGHTEASCKTCSGKSIERRGRCGSCKGTGTEYIEANVLLDTSDLNRGLSALAVEIHGDNCRAGWWTDLNSGQRQDLLTTRNRGELLMLSVTELDEAVDAHLGGLMDDKLPHRLGFSVELADCAIRVLDTLGAEARQHGGSALVPFSDKHGTVSVDSFVVEYRNDRRGTIGDVFRIVADLSKALDEGYRKGFHKLARFHLTSALFRIIALAEVEYIPLFEIIEEKRDFNRHRADHKIENRIKSGGKKL